jgi:hypothetical protein
LGAGLPDFSLHNKPKRVKYTKKSQKYRMAINYVYQMAIKIINGHEKYTTFQSKGFPKCTKNDIIGKQKYRLATLVGRPP